MRKLEDENGSEELGSERSNTPNRMSANSSSTSLIQNINKIIQIINLSFGRKLFRFGGSTQKSATATGLQLFNGGTMQFTPARCFPTIQKAAQSIDIFEHSQLFPARPLHPQIFQRRFGGAGGNARVKENI